MELRLESASLRQALVKASQLLADQRLVAVMGDRFLLSTFCLAVPVQPVLVGAATTEDEGFSVVMRTQPDLLICTSDLEAGYGIHLLQRVKAACPRTRLMIFLGRETREVVQEALRACADAVMFRSSMGSATSDFMQALVAVAQGQVYYPEAIRRLGSAQPIHPALPPPVEPLSDRELEVVGAIARGLKNPAVANLLGISPETVKTHVVHAMGKLGARDRTQLAVLALLHGLINPLD